MSERAGTDTRAPVRLTFAGQPIEARAGDTVAMALWAAEQRELRHSSRLGAPRAVFCNMGICYECLVRIDGTTVRACTTVVRDGMQIELGGQHD